MTLRFTAAIAVLDIEGTTGAAGYVHGELYDYARPRLGPWIDAHPDDAEVATAVATSGSSACASIHGPSRGRAWS